MPKYTVTRKPNRLGLLPVSTVFGVIQYTYNMETCMWSNHFVELLLSFTPEWCRCVWSVRCEMKHSRPFHQTLATKFTGICIAVGMWPWHYRCNKQIIIGLVDIYSIMMLVEFSDLSQSDRSNWVMWQVKDPCPRPGWDRCRTRE